MSEMRTLNLKQDQLLLMYPGVRQSQGRATYPQPQRLNARSLQLQLPDLVGTSKKAGA